MNKNNSNKKKPKNEQSVLAEAIVKYLKKKRGKSYTSKELARSLNIHKQNYHLYRQALQEMLKAGKIIRLKDKIESAEPGDYKLKVRIRKDDQKTTKEITEDITVIKEEKQDAASISEEEHDVPEKKQGYP
jgi:hypothetical protein